VSRAAIKNKTQMHNKLYCLVEKIKAETGSVVKE
jgi:hypothetical protein